MRISGKALAAFALLSFSPLCMAEVYVGAGGNMSSYKYDDVKRGFGPQVFVGYRVDTMPVMFEVGYFSTGKNKVDGSVTLQDSSGQTYTVSDMALSWSGAIASLGYFGKWDANGSSVYGKVGYYGGKSKLDANVSGFGDVTLKGSSSGLMFAIGADWMVNPSFGLRFDLGSLLNVKTTPDFGNEKSNVTTFGFGVVFPFSTK